MVPVSVQTHPQHPKSHDPHCGCAACLSRCDLEAMTGARIPINAAWWKTQTIFPVTSLDPSSIKQPSRCPSCRGVGRTIVKRPCPLYACGYITEAVHCRACAGCGIVSALPADHKLAASGDTQ